MIVPRLYIDDQPIDRVERIMREVGPEPAPAAETMAVEPPTPQRRPQRRSRHPKIGFFDIDGGDPEPVYVLGRVANPEEGNVTIV